MPKNSIEEVRELLVPLDDVKRLTEEARFTYYLLGFIFNELNSLQKWISFALPKHDDMRPILREPEMGQALFLFRLACGKIWEAHASLTSQEVAGVLRQYVLPNMVNGTSRLKSLNSAIGAAPWLPKLRNGLGFHFPRLRDWRPLIQPDESWVADSIYFANQTGNTYYAGSESIAQAWMFGLYGAAHIHEAVDPLIKQMIDLLGQVNSFLEDAIGAFVTDEILSSPQQVKNHGPLEAPRFEEVILPFWTSIPPP